MHNTRRQRHCETVVSVRECGCRCVRMLCTWTSTCVMYPSIIMAVSVPAYACLGILQARTPPPVGCPKPRSLPRCVAISTLLMMGSWLRMYPVGGPLLLLKQQPRIKEKPCETLLFLLPRVTSCPLGAAEKRSYASEIVEPRPLMLPQWSTEIDSCPAAEPDELVENVFHLGTSKLPQRRVATLCAR